MLIIKQKLIVDIWLSFDEEQHENGPIHFSSSLAPDAIVEIYERTKLHGDDTLLVYIESLHDVFTSLQQEGFLEGQVIALLEESSQAIVYDPEGRHVLLFEKV